MPRPRDQLGRARPAASPPMAGWHDHPQTAYQLGRRDGLPRAHGWGSDAVDLPLALLPGPYGWRGPRAPSEWTIPRAGAGRSPHAWARAAGSRRSPPRPTVPSGRRRATDRAAASSNDRHAGG